MSSLFSYRGNFKTCIPTYNISYTHFFVHIYFLEIFIMFSFPNAF